jgi:membrane protein implicated in regulation of membrane protease activity
MTWWGWMILGAIFMGAELFAVDAQFYLIFLGFSALLVGVLGVVGIVIPEWAQWIAFAVFSLISMFTFRKTLYEKIRGNTPGFRDPLEGESVTVTNSLEPDNDGRTIHRGTEWSIRNVGENTIEGGSKARILGIEGTVLHVSAD